MTQPAPAAPTSPATPATPYVRPADQPEIKAITFQPSIYPVVLGHVPDDRSISVLDVGSGEGYVAQELLKKGYTNVHAVDFNEEDFKLKGVPFTEADLNASIPLPDNSFDCVISVEVAEHVENHFRYFSEMMRVLKPGGTIIISTPNVLSISSRIHFFLYGFTDCCRRPANPFYLHHMQHVNPISLPEIMFHIEYGGCELVKLDTNRQRRSSWVLMPILYPLLKLAIKKKLDRPNKYSDEIDRYREHAKHITSVANLLGRITIAVATKTRPGPDDAKMAEAASQLSGGEAVGHTQP